MCSTAPAFLMMNSKLVIFPPTRPELLRLAYPSEAVQMKVKYLLPLANTWYQQAERQLYSLGRPLSSREQHIASKLDVQAPEQVRVLIVDEFPKPEQTELQQAAEGLGIGGETELARTLGYVILIKPDNAHDPLVLQHELVHVSQIERLGRELFIERYLYELEIVGYARAPLELEAYAKQDLSF